MAERGVFTAAGVSIRRPTPGGSRAPDHDKRSALSHPPTNASPPQAQEGKDAELLAMFQQLAFHYAMEQTRFAVGAILLNVNKKCYSDAHVYFQRHMQRVSGCDLTTAAVPRPVAFPTLAKIPAVAIVSGSDATFSDVWMKPLCQVMHRSFPAIFVARDDMAGGRQMLEWVVAGLSDYAGVKNRDEAWLMAQIESFTPHDHSNGGDRDSADESNGTESASYKHRRRPVRTTRTRNGHSLKRPAAATSGWESDGASDDAYHQQDDASDSSASSSESDGGDAKKKKPQNRKKRKRSGKTRTGGYLPRSEYHPLLLNDLMGMLRDKLQLLAPDNDPTVTWAATLRDLVLEALATKLADCSGDIPRSIACYDACIDELTSRVVAYRRQVGFATTPSHLRIATAEYSLATVIYRIMNEFVLYLASCTPRSQAEQDLVQRTTRKVSNMVLRHEDTYNFHKFHVSDYDVVRSHCEPYLLICIERLDGFNLQALQEFVDLWGHSTSLHQAPLRLGFIFGVTSTTSQTLRSLGKSIKRRVDIQFYPLEDSKTQSEVILETLFVHNHFPLCLRGQTLRLLNDRHLTSQSLTVFFQVLELVALSHFQEDPWAFLNHFAFDAHYLKPLQANASTPAALRRQIKQSNLRGRSVRECLGSLSHAQINQVFGKLNKTSGSKADTEPRDPIEVVEEELARCRAKRMEWVVGWQCFRVAWGFFNLHTRGEGFVDCLVLALDGRLRQSKMAEWIRMMLEVRSIQLITDLLNEWAALSSRLLDKALYRDLQDLIVLALYVQDTYFEPETTKMRPSFRAEIVHFFTTRILSLMDADQVATTSVRGTVQSWATVSASQSSTLASHVSLHLHEDILPSLSALDDGAYEGSTAAADLSLAFSYYREHAALQLNVSDWFDSFAEAVNEESAGNGKDASERLSSEALNARFARALATLRLWGYVKGPDGVRGSGRRHQDMKVDKNIFM